ncbi:hypothetical protein EJ07DRAFT_160511 [Lizonia empirigonia]|nr:hypothetical protein EJ07DRAFT_160511 [Lizonia empirigonia]
MWFNWQNFGENKEVYESLLVYLLDKKPGHAQDFITVLASDKSLPDSKSVILADALAHLQSYTSEETILWIRAGRLRPTRTVESSFQHSFSARESRTRLSVGTTLHYASAFGEAGEFRQALQCLDRRLAAFKPRERELVVDSERFRWTCAAILRGSMREAKNYHETPSIVAALVNFGVKMDLLLYDVVMRNAMDAGDFATAFKVYNALDKNGLVPDKYTFSILLHGCTRQNDPAMFKAFAEWCVTKAKELDDPWLATDCLYYTYICELNKVPTGREMSSIWWTYLDLFDLKPLGPFTRDGSRSMRDAIDQQIVDPKAQKLAPTPLALYLMLQTEIHTTQTLGAQYLERLYRTFKRALIKEPQSALASLSRTRSYGTPSCTPSAPQHNRIGETMQHIGDQEQLDPGLLRLLGQVQQRRDLTVALETSRIEKETREAEENARKVREEEKRFETPQFASLLTNALRFRPAAHWDNGDANDDFLEPDDESVDEVESKITPAQIGHKANDSAVEETQPPDGSKLDLQFKSLLGNRPQGVVAQSVPKRDDMDEK